MTQNGTLNRKQAIQHGNRMYYTNSKTKKKYSFLCTPFWRLTSLGRSSMLYLYISLLVVVFFVILSALHAPYLYYYVQKTNPSTFFQMSMANYDLNSSGGVNIAFGTLEVVIALFSIVYLRFLFWITKRINDKVAKRTISVADYSIHIRDLPSTEAAHGKKRLYKHFSKFGKLDNIALALDCGDISKSIKKKDELIKEIEKCDIVISRGGCFVLIEKIKRIYFSIYLNFIQKDIAKSMRKKAYRCTGDAFITFENEKARFKCLHSFNRPMIQRLCSKSGTYSKKKHRIRVEPAHEPHDIIWENLEYSVISKYSRRSVSFLASILFSAAVVAVAVVLEVLKKDKFSSISISDWIENPSFQNWQIFASLGLSVLVFILVQIMTYILYLLSNFEKHRFQLHAKQSLMMKVTFGSFLTTIAYLFVYLTSPTVGSYYTEMTDNSVIIPKGAFTLAGNVNVPILVETSAWYSSLFFVTCTSVASNTLKDALLGIYHYFLKRYRIATSVTQEDLNKAHEPPVYSYEYRYSYQLKNMFIGIVFSGLFPVTLFIITGGLLACYFVDKFNILKIYRAEGKEVDLLSPTALNFLSIAFLIRYILMSITRIYFTISLNYDPSNTSQPVLSIITPYHICFFSAFLLYIIYLIIHFFTSGTNFVQKYFCCPRFRHPSYITKNGEKSINDYRNGFDKYVPPIDVSNVKYVYHGEELEANDPNQEKLHPKMAAQIV